MRWILEQMRRVRRGEEGFTLIELLIVILILGILAGIAVFASGPFRDRAEAACADANTEIGIIADAATDAGVTGDLYAQGPDCSGAGGSAPVSFAASFVGSTDDNEDGVTVSATTGNLLVALAGHRETPAPLGEGAAGGTTDVAAPTASGWTYQGHVFFETSTGDRRGLGVFTKVADGSDDIDVEWEDTNDPGDDVPMDVHVFEFSRSGDDPDWTNTVLDFAYVEDGISSGVAFSETVDGGTGDALLIAGIVGRAGPDSVSAFNSGGAAGSGSGSGSPDVGVWIGYEEVTDAGPFSATFTFSGGSGYSGIVMLIR